MLLGSSKRKANQFFSTVQVSAATSKSIKNSHFNLSLSPASATLGFAAQSSRSSKRKKWYWIAGITLGLALIGAVVFLAIYFTRNSAGLSEQAIFVSIGDQTVNLEAGGYYEIPFSKSGQVLTLVQSSKIPIPAGRSYDGNNWEQVRPLALPFDCTVNTCKVRIPQGKGNYSIFPITAFVRSDENIVADFLIQSTFGPTRSLIQAFPKDGDFSARARSYFIDQMNIPATLHRAYYRRRANTLVERDSQAKTFGPCESKSRWTRLAFDRFDIFKPFTVVNFQIFVDGVLRTELPPSFNLTKTFGATQGSFYFCFLYSNIASVGAPIPFSTSRASCDQQPLSYLSHPELYFSSPNGLSIMHRNAQFTSLSPPVDGSFLLTNPLPGCVDPQHSNLYATDFSGKYYKYQPRMKIFDNSMENPIINAELKTLSSLKDFVNEKACKPRTSSAQYTFSSSSSIRLNQTTLMKLSEFSNSVVLYADGDGLKPVTAPCASAGTIRFRRSAVSCANPASPSTSITYLSNLIAQKATILSLIVDVEVNSPSSCSETPIGVEIQLQSNQCWTHVHNDLFSVFDFSQYLYEHPNGPDNIRLSSNGRLNYPHSNTNFWELNRSKFQFIGVLNNDITFTSLQQKFKTYESAQYFNALQSSNGVSYFEYCGSIGEVSNTPEIGDRYYFMYDPKVSFDGAYLGYLDNTNNTESWSAKSKVWTNLALKSDDQLRQRAAWALAQIFVINYNGIETFGRYTEGWVKYYDIFVRHAFGNYFDIMKEVSYSPMMGTMLSYLNSVSFQRNMETVMLPIYPDENYARELMQLFSIGLWKLSTNGSKIVDSNGRTLETYNNLNIQSFARIWTGFKANKDRRNIETCYPYNTVDPMVITAADHDTFPKEGLDGSYIGDEFPLCSMLPKLAFLKKGAKFSFIGSSTSPVLMAKMSSFELSAPQSDLYKLLCNADSLGFCQLESQYVLANNIPCYGAECDIDVIRTIKLKVSSSDYVFYEYVQQPCVELEFPESGVLTTGSSGNYPVCTNRRAIKASPACCKRPNDVQAQERVNYNGETTTFQTSVSRCLRFNETLCSFTSVSTVSDMSLNGIPWSAPRFWSSAQCNVRAQVFPDGRISFSHMPSSWTGTTFYGLKLNSNIKLRVAWENSNYPLASNQCNNLCEVVGSTCVCETSVIKSAVFTDSKKIPLVSDILEKLKIGSAAPASFDAGIYSIAYESEEQGLTVYVDSSKSFNENTVFEVRTVGSRVRYFANMKSSVSIKSAFSFRNPPNFMQHDERTVRDVQYEVDALLQHLLYHPSAAPFVSDFLIKRFVTSNPTPHYVQTVSNAFMSGKYNGIGSGKYGDMASTFAAVLLYRDSVSSAIKSDKYHGLMREPLLKIIHFMRALELRSSINSDMDLNYFNNLIGEESYSSPSVFNFYQSEFQPSGDIADSGLYAPEAQILNPPQTISYSNAMLNLVHMGLSSCFEALGPSLRFDSMNCYYFQNLYPSGVLKYEDFLGSLSSRALIAKLSTLLTGGRLDVHRSDIMQTIYDSSFNRTNSSSTAVKKVLSAFAITPEFQITNFAKSNFTTEKKKTTELNSSGGYKALVYVFLHGGMDSYNLLVPHSSCSGENLYDQYTSIRGTSALQKSQLLEINVPAWGAQQPCSKFGVIDKMPFLKSLYDSQEVSFISNIGTLVEPLTSSEFFKSAKKTPVGLFAHNVQQNVVRSLVSDSLSAKGVIGRLREYLHRANKSSQSYSMHGFFAPILEGDVSQITPQTILHPAYGVSSLDQHVLYTSLKPSLLNLTAAESDSIFANTWSNVFQNSVKQSSKLSEVLKFTPANPTYKYDWVSNQLNYASRIMSNRKKLKSAVDVFYVEKPGFDTHNSFTLFGDNMKSLDDDLKAFVNDLKSKGLWENVTIVVASDFGRTLRGNGQGTDHGWGGNSFILGGSVKGGQILGKFPSDMRDFSEYNIGNGVFVPTSPWEAIWKPILSWIGVEKSGIDKILPYLKNFPSSHLFADESVFKSTYSNPVESPEVAGFTIRESSGNTALLFDKDGYFYIQALDSLDDSVIPVHFNQVKESTEFEMVGAEIVNGINRIMWRRRTDDTLYPWRMDENWKLLWGEAGAVLKSPEYYEFERQFQQDFDKDGKISFP
jgi:uncharacterized protein (DUF1501 family)/uncharacterized protein (DUF1800 family)